MSNVIVQHETRYFDNVSCAEFADMTNIDIRKARQLTKLKDKSLRPPGYFIGKKQYRIWVSELPDYLHSEGKYSDGGFARAMEVCNA